MIVERNDTKKLVDFGKINLGQFFDSNGYVFLKIESTSKGFNALDCDKNSLVQFMSYTKVTPLNGKVVIE